MLNKKGLTLTEVVIASTLIIIIVFGATAFQLYAINVFNTLRSRSVVDSDASYIMAHIMKNLNEATDIGFGATERGFSVSGDQLSLTIRKGLDPSGSDYQYWWYSSSHQSYPYQVHYFPPPGGGSGILLGRVEGLWFTKYDQPKDEMLGFGIEDDETIRNVVSINIVSRKNLDEPESLDNPKIVLQSTFVPRAMTSQE